MKQIYSFFSKRLNVAFVIAIIIAVSSFVVACSQEEVNKLPYLEISSDVSKLTEFDMNILKMARERMDEYVVLKDGRFQTSLTAGKQINISENLFDIFTASMEQTNRLIQENPTLLNPQKITSPVRLKTGNPEILPGTNGSEVRWYGFDIYLNNATAIDVAYYLLQGATGAAAAATIISSLGAPEVGVVVLVISTYAFLLSNSINHSNSGNGVCISIYIPLTGIPLYSTESR